MSDLGLVLYAEDDENDAFLMERAFEKLKIPNPLKIVTDGKQAIAYLAGQAPFTNRTENPLPSLMLMDLSMPGRHGLEVLRWIKSQPSLSRMPVVVLTSSSQESDIHCSYLFGASGFLVKPGDPDELLSIIRGIQQYWLTEPRPSGEFVDFAAANNVRRPKSAAK
jgi:CheY-like chemotaxis protein